MAKTAKKRSYGDGYVRQVKDKHGNLVKDKWEVGISYVDQLTGKRRRKTEIVNGKKTKANKRRAELKAEYNSGLDFDGGEMPFLDFANEWQKRRESAGEVGHHDLKHSAYVIKYVANFIGHMRLRDIKTETVESLRVAIRDDKRKPDGTTISPRTLQCYEKVLKQIFKTAVNYDYIIRSPYDRASKVKQKKPERRALSAEDTKKFNDKIIEAEAKALKEYREKEQRQKYWSADKRREGIRGLFQLSCLMAVRLGLATGMRRGEVLGLTWGEVYSDGHIRVTKACEYVDHGPDKGVVRLKEPKTASSVRDIWLDPETMKQLKKWRKFQAQELMKINVLAEGKPKADTPVCCANTGGLIDPNNFSRWWTDWRVEVGYPGLLFHELRHTQATRLLSSGADVKTVQQRLGHSSPLITVDVYTHADEANARNAAARMGAILNGKRAANVVKFPA